MIEISDDQSDAIGEFFNIAMGRAVESLSRMVDRSISLSVPKVEIVTLNEVENNTKPQFGSFICGVAQEFSGGLNGKIMLVFPEEKSLELVRLMLGDEVPLDTMTEMEQDALTEVGNVLLNACLGTFADLNKVRINSHIPLFVRGSMANVLNLPRSDDDEQNVGLLVHIMFGIEKADISGHVMMMLKLSSMKFFFEMMEEYFEGSIE